MTTLAAPFTPPRHTSSFLRALAVCTSLCLSALAFAADAPKQSFNLPADSAEKSLRSFSQQSGLEVIFPTGVVQGVRTNPVSGEMSARDALDAMLADTGLVVVQDRSTGAFSVRKETPAESKNAQRVAQEESSHPRRAASVNKDGVIELDQFEVTGSRLRTTLDTASVQPVFIYSRQELDRAGVNTLSDLQRLIPQLPPPNFLAPSGSLIGNTTSGLGQVNFGTGLRGIGNTNTLILVNGRRVNKLGQRDGRDAYDLSGVPMSAVERVEVLTDGASAVYGADALAGVINIILKKDYRGAEVTLTYGNLLVTDRAYKNVQIAAGYRTGPWSINITGTFSKTDTAQLQDYKYPWAQSDDRRAFGGSDLRGPAPGGTGAITIIGTLPPGFSTATVAIPRNSNGTTTTIADYQNAGPIAPLFDSPRDSRALRNDFYTKTFRLTSDYEIAPWLTLFVEGSHSELGGHAERLAMLQTTVPAGYSGNPFGVPVFVSRVFWELSPYLALDYSNVQNSALFGARGNLPNDWRYEATVSTRFADYGTGVPNLGFAQLSAAINNADPSKRPILLNDGLTSSPNSPEVLRSLLLADQGAAEKPLSWIYDFRADGPVWSLPAGDIRLAAGGEFIQDYSRFPVVAASNPSFGNVSRKRETLGLFAELEVPLISDKQNIPLVSKLSANLSARRDSYSDFPSRTSPRYSLLWWPFKSVALRGSYGEGYRVPTLQQLYQPFGVVNSNTRLGGVTAGATPTDPGYVTNLGTLRITAPVIDRARNNEILALYPTFFPNPSVDPIGGDGPMGNFLTSIQGGNPSLRPESSRNLNFGLVVDIPYIKGLSLSADYYELTYLDRVTSGIPGGNTPAVQQLILDFFPERVIRAAPSAADQAAGLAGRIIQLNLQNMNIAYLRTRGFDFEVRYHRQIGRFGELQFRATATKTKESFSRILPTSPILSDAAEKPWRGAGSLTWLSGAWEAGTYFSYTGAIRVGAANSYILTQGTVLPSEFIIGNDYYFSYDFGKNSKRSDTQLGRIFSGLRVSLNLTNVFDREPKLIQGYPTGTLPIGGRGFQLTVRKAF